MSVASTADPSVVLSVAWKVAWMVATLVSLSAETTAGSKVAVLDCSKAGQSAALMVATWAAEKVARWACLSVALWAALMVDSLVVYLAVWKVASMVVSLVSLSAEMTAAIWAA